MRNTARITSSTISTRISASVFLLALVTRTMLYWMLRFTVHARTVALSHISIDVSNHGTITPSSVAINAITRHPYRCKLFTRLSFLWYEDTAQQLTVAQAAHVLLKLFDALHVGAYHHHIGHVY